MVKDNGAVVTSSGIPLSLDEETVFVSVVADFQDSLRAAVVAATVREVAVVSVHPHGMFIIQPLLAWLPWRWKEPVPGKNVP